MSVSVLFYKNHQNAEMEGYDVQMLVYLFYHRSPEQFLHLILTSDLCEEEIRSHLLILSTNFQY